MSIAVNGIAHIQLSVAKPESIVFWETLCNFLDMKTLLRNPTTVYCIGSRTGLLARLIPPDSDAPAFNQDSPGLHHFCFRARSREDIDQIFTFVTKELDPHVIHGPQDGDEFAPGYYSILFEDPDGIRVEFNYVPGQGHFGEKGRLGERGAGVATHYSEAGLSNS